MDSWNPNLYKQKDWRTISENYHHSLLPNINVIEHWGKNKQTLITNSLGFRDSSQRKIKKTNDKERILLIGDSFIEGLGYDYELTVSGLLQKHYGSEYEILNSAVASYSPSIYYFKTKHYIEEGYKFDKALVFLDLSDIVDETYLEFNSDNTIKVPANNLSNNILKEKIYKFSYFLRDNFLTFRVISLLSDKTEFLKNEIKDKYRASKYFNINFFDLNKKDLNLYKMINVKRGNWVKNVDRNKKVDLGLERSQIFLDKLFNILKKNSIDSYLIIYPWPSQIFYENLFYENFWKSFSKERNINFVNLNKYFNEANKMDTIHKYFIPGDVHWNEKGTEIIFKAILEEKIINNL